MYSFPGRLTVSFALIGLGMTLAAAAWFAAEPAQAGKAAAREADAPYTVLEQGIGFANDIAVGADGRVFVSVQNGPIFQFSPRGNSGFTVPQAHPATVQEEYSRRLVEAPRQLALDREGNLFVEDNVTIHGCIPLQGVRRIAPDNTIATLTEQGYHSRREAAPVELDQINAIAKGADGNLYVNADKILKITPQGRGSVLYDPRQPPAAGHVPILDDLAPHPDGSLLALDGGQRIYRISMAGVATKIIGQFEGSGCPSRDGPANEARLCGAERLAVAPDGVIYVLEGECEVRKIAGDGAISTIFTPEGSGTLAPVIFPGSLCPFRSIAVGGNGDIYLAGQRVVRLRDPTRGRGR